MSNADRMTIAESYRLAIARPDSRQLMTIQSPQGYALPLVPVPHDARIAEHILNFAKATWNIHIVVLETIKASDDKVPCILAEALLPDEMSSFNTTPVEGILSSELSEDQRERLECLLDFAERTDGPFTRLGWIDEAIKWLEASTTDRLSSKKDIRQFRAGSTSCLVRLQVEDGSGYWLKATGGPDAHERTITEYLYEQCPDYLPRIVASRPDWNAWIMQEEGKPLPGNPASSLDVLTELEQAVTSMSKLQDKSSGVSLDILDAGAFDQSIEALSSRVPEVFDYLEEAMSLAGSAGEARLPKSRIARLRRIFSEVLDKTDGLAIDETIIHGNLRWEHILTGMGWSQFIDWAEAYLAYPVISLQHFLDLNTVGSSEVRDLIRRFLIGKYCDYWAMYTDREWITESLIYMPMLALGSTLYGRGDWLNTDARYDLQRLSNAVEVAFRMNEVASDPALLSKL